MCTMQQPRPRLHPFSLMSAVQNGLARECCRTSLAMSQTLGVELTEILPSDAPDLRLR